MHSEKYLQWPISLGLWIISPHNDECLLSRTDVQTSTDKCPELSVVLFREAYSVEGSLGIRKCYGEP